MFYSIYCGLKKKSFNKLESEKETVSFLYSWNKRLFRIQLAQSKLSNYLLRQNCFLALQKFVGSLKNEFCQVTKQ